MGPKMRLTQVARVEDLSPHMRRIILTGEDLKDFPEGQESAHVKAIFPQTGELKPKAGFLAGSKKWMRSYTIRAFDSDSKELTIDFAVNDHKGLAADWASNATPGAYLGIAGPGPTKYTNYHADWHLIVADLTALPAAATVLEKLPNNAQGYAVIQVPSKEDIQPFRIPNGISLKWVIGPYQTKNLLLEKVKALNWLSGEPAIFIAAESVHMREIKDFVKFQSGYLSDQTYASGYWKV